MRLRTAAALAGCVVLSNAFQGTSPLIVVSTSRSSLDQLPANNAIVRSSEIQLQIAKSISKCVTDNYVLVNQPELSATEFRSTNMPHLRRLLSSDGSGGSVYKTFEMIGKLNISDFDTLLTEKCKSRVLVADPTHGIIPQNKDGKQVIRIAFPQLPMSSTRSGRLNEHDSYLNAVLDTLPGNSFTLLYTTTTNPYAAEVELQQQELGYQYDMEMLSPEAMHLDLKRDVVGHLEKRQDDPNKGWDPNAPLFDKYAFFNPAIFMALIAFIIMLSIGYVGVSWLASIQVTYAAFNKEMGPSAQKKQQ